MRMPCAGGSTTGGGSRRTWDGRANRLVLPAVGRHHGVDGVAVGPMSKGYDRAALIHAVGLPEVAHGACAAGTLRDVQATRQAVPGEFDARDLGLDVLPKCALRVSGVATTPLLGACGGGCVVAPRRGAIRIRELVRARPVRRVALGRILEGALVEVALRALVLGHQVLPARIGAGLLRGLHAVRGRAQLAHRRWQVPRRRATTAVATARSTAVPHGYPDGGPGTAVWCLRWQTCDAHHAS